MSCARSSLNETRALHSLVEGKSRYEDSNNSAASSTNSKETFLASFSFRISGQTEEKGLQHTTQVVLRGPRSIAPNTNFRVATTLARSSKAMAKPKSQTHAKSQACEHTPAFKGQGASTREVKEEKGIRQRIERRPNYKNVQVLP